MATQHVVVDGSNIATEGRSTPSLAQLDAAVEELHKELPEAEVTVVVDATFAHRIDPSELERFEQAALRGEFVYPPAGAIGRGDAFLLRIAERVDGIVLSNDSFQEFHGEHEWIFERGRLLGATPVPGVGWIFVPRTPVRGPKSRVAVRDAHRAKERVVKAIAEATAEAVDPEPTDAPARSRRSRERGDRPAPQAVNDPMTFISFIAEHPLGEELEGLVDSFTSHGAVVRFGDVRSYIPLSGLGDPAPRAAREVLQRGETRTFVITALDPFRRGVELALPGVAVVSGRPSDETVEAEVRMARSGGKRAGRKDADEISAEPESVRGGARKRGTGADGRRAAAPAKRAAAAAKESAAPADEAPSNKAAGARSAAKKAAGTSPAPKKAGRAGAAPKKAATTSSSRAGAAPREAAATRAGRSTAAAAASATTSPVKAT
jgi:hypothetical protein